MAKSKHDQVATKLAKKENAEYNQGQGADIQGPTRILEVETPDTIDDASRQLRGYRMPVYVVGTNQEAVDKASKHYQNTTIGVMTSNGKIVKRSTRKKS